MLEFITPEDKNKYIISVMTKRAYYNSRFESAFGFWITVKNWVDGIFDSFCHTELHFMDKWSWSASEAKDRLNKKGGRCGTGFKNIKYSHPERWVRVPIDVRDPRLPISYDSVYELKKRCLYLTGREYDVLGCIGQGVGNEKIEDRTKFFCSEAVGYVFGFPSMTPAVLHKELIELLKQPVQE